MVYPDKGQSQLNCKISWLALIDVGIDGSNWYLVLKQIAKRFFSLVALEKLS